MQELKAKGLEELNATLAELGLGGESTEAPKGEVVGESEAAVRRRKKKER